MSLELVEFASQGVNTILSVSIFSFTNFLEVLPNTFGRCNILDLMALLRNQMICVEHPHLSVKGKILLLSFYEIFFVNHSDTILNNIPGIHINGYDVPHHLILPV